MKVQIREEWLIKDEFSCIKCGASNEHIKWNDEGSDHPALQPEGVLFCEKCIHKLTEKKELEDLVYFVKVCQYGFFIRIIHDHFIPCNKCQEELEEILVGQIEHWKIDGEMKVGLELINTMKGLDYVKTWGFSFSWINTTDTVILCKKCSKALEEGIVNAEKWTIGNKDYKPPIELWRKWKIDDGRTQQLEKLMKRARNVGIHKNSFLACTRNKVTTKEFDEYIRTTNKQVKLMEEQKRLEEKRLKRITPSGAKSEDWKPDSNLSMVIGKSQDYKPKA